MVSRHALLAQTSGPDCKLSVKPVPSALECGGILTCTGVCLDSMSETLMDAIAGQSHVRV